jgi:acetyl-CoA C-acetyltransferase
MSTDLTPVIVGVGQFAERLNADHYQGLSAVEIAVEASRAALADALSPDALAAEVDYIGTTRTFEDSVPHLAFPFGKSNNFPRSICRRLGIDPAWAVWEEMGGDTPQRLVSEACEKIAAGAYRMALLTGAEAISTARHLQKQGVSVDWSETVDGQVEDRKGRGGRIIAERGPRHGLWTVALLYGLCENAHRGRLGQSRAQCRAAMAEWFAPFTRVAAANPYASMENREYSPGELAELTAQNRPIADPYPRLMVSRDQVNQGAAVLVTSVGRARALGIPESQWIYLHGYAEATERELEERADLGRYPAGVAAARAALAAAGVTVDDIDLFDFYSCFPIAVSSVAEPLGLAPADPRGLTVTGGLPYFGGPGNNYSMHAIATLVERLRAGGGTYGFVGANGGFLSKYAVGIYSTRSAPFRVCDSSALQAELDAVPAPAFTDTPEGPATIETYTLSYGRDGEPEHAVILGRLRAGGQRFMACTAPGDAPTLAMLVAEEPLGMAIEVRPADGVNHFSAAAEGIHRAAAGSD